MPDAVDFRPEVTPELIQRVRDSGFDAIRIPAAGDQHADPATASIFDQRVLDAALRGADKADG